MTYIHVWGSNPKIKGQVGLFISIKLVVEVDANSDNFFLCWISFHIMVFSLHGNIFSQGQKPQYLDCIKNFGIVDSIGRFRMGKLRVRNVKNPVLPVTGLCLPIPEGVYTRSLPSSLMPGSLIPMSIPKPIDSKTMHFVCKIFPSVCVPIPAFSYEAH